MARIKPPALRLPMRVWDLPTRLFHIIIMVLVVVSYVSVKLARSQPDLMQVHLLSGYTVLTLLIFRLAWGFVGSETARFGRFLTSPLTGLRHLGLFGRRAPDDQVGHNPAGGWMVLILLGLLAAQVGTGLFSHMRDLAAGPLAKYVDAATSDEISFAHGALFKILAVAIALHVAAILAYAVVQRQDLVRPMVTGKKRLPATTRAPRMASPILALIVLILAAIVVGALATLA